MTVNEERQFAVMCSSWTLTKPWAWLSLDGNYGCFSCFISVPFQIILTGPNLCYNNLQKMTETDQTKIPKT